MKIQEIIVVEGRDDTTAIKQALNADTIETNGSAINKSIIDQIKLAQQTRGVIVFTDPDFPGDKIRHTIIEQVPDCKQAFLAKHLAIHKSGKGLGVEHASPEAIREALKHAKLMKEDMPERISQEDLILAGLIAGPGARKRREILGQYLKIGYTNGKQLYHRLKMFSISPEEFKEALQYVNGVTEHE